MYIILIPDHPQNLSVFLFHIIYKQTRPTKFHQIVDFAEIRIRHVLDTINRFNNQQIQNRPLPPLSSVKIVQPLFEICFPGLISSK